MKLVIASQGNDMFSMVNPDLGTAKFFLLVDTALGQITAHISNEHADVAGGVDMQAARDVLSLGGEALISGDISPEAVATLQAANADIYIGAKGTVARAVEQYKLNQLQPVGEAKVEDIRAES